MTPQIIFAICVAIVLVVALVVYKIKTKGIRKFAIEMITQAERVFRQGENKEKMAFVIDGILGFIPAPFRFLITRSMVEAFIQKIFDEIKIALDYKGEQIMEEDLIIGSTEIPELENPDDREYENVEIETEGGK